MTSVPPLGGGGERERDLGRTDVLVRQTPVCASCVGWGSRAVILPFAEVYVFARRLSGLFLASPRDTPRRRGLATRFALHEGVTRASAIMSRELDDARRHALFLSREDNVPALLLFLGGEGRRERRRRR